LPGFNCFIKELMGKGDRRSRRGKIAAGTFGNLRPKARRKKAAKKPVPARPAVKKKPAGRK
jgi:ribosomal small subunit protein bTHX